jgi:hypothetical protein
MSVSINMRQGRRVITQKQVAMLAAIETVALKTEYDAR